MTRTFAAISHKGGTGRSVTLANIAFRLALQGRDVCCVDLDLTSPTLGSVLGISSLETGVADVGRAVSPRSISDILNSANDAQTVLTSFEAALINVWGESQELRPLRPPSIPRFDLLPGKKNIDTSMLDLRRLAPLLERLNERYEIVLLDVRSGNSEIAEALLTPECDAHINSWLLHFRWTRQHLAGVANYVSSFQENAGGRFDNRILLVSTAYPHLGTNVTDALRNELVTYNNRLEARRRELTTRLGREMLGRVPFDELLLWKETVVTPPMVERRVARRETSDSFETIANGIVRRLEESGA